VDVEWETSDIKYIILLSARPQAHRIVLQSILLPEWIIFPAVNDTDYTASFAAAAFVSVRWERSVNVSAGAVSVKVC